MPASNDEALSRESSLFKRLLNLILVVWILLHIYTVWKLPFSLDELKFLHLGFAISTLFLSI